MAFNTQVALQELVFKAVKSSGSGGQHVNKVATKIELSYHLKTSLALSEIQKKHLLKKLDKKISKEGVLILQCSESRSQYRNKTLVIKRFVALMQTSLFIPKKRIPTKKSKTVIRKRLKNKAHISDKKVNRRKINLE